MELLGKGKDLDVERRDEGKIKKLVVFRGHESRLSTYRQEPDRISDFRCGARERDQVSLGQRHGPRR